MKEFEVWTRMILDKCYRVKAENEEDAIHKWEDWNGEESDDIYWVEGEDIYGKEEINEAYEI